jgi:hypothetical protein
MIFSKFELYLNALKRFQNIGALKLFGDLRHSLF